MLILECLQPVLLAQTSGPTDVPRMTIEQLRMQLDKPDFVIIDVRSAKDWENSPVQIKGAVREDGNKVDSWAAKYPKEKTIVLY
jgi:rhodanese-related sulfurtransferase